MTETSRRREPEPLGVGAGLISSAFAAIVGILVGFITTLTHSQWWPWGLMAGLLVVVALVAGFRLIFDSRAVAAAAAAGVIATILVLAFPAPGGIAVTLSSVHGILWMIGAVALSAIVVAVPRSRARATASAPHASGAE